MQGRKDLLRLIGMVEDWEADILLTYAPDRLSREQFNSGAIMATVQRARGVDDFVTETFDNNAMGKLLFLFQAAMAEMEREKIAERMMRGKLAKMKAGKLVGAGTPAYGWSRDREAGRLLINEPEAAVIRRIYTDPPATPSRQPGAGHQVH
jgi:site-specific DNA recombinase